MIRQLKKLLLLFNIDPVSLLEWVAKKSILLTLAKKDRGLIDRLKEIAPGIQDQYSRPFEKFGSYLELKMRNQHAFQVELMIELLNQVYQANPSDELVVVDIGDSAGTHMQYLKELAYKDHGINIETISVNLDPRAVEKIKNRGQRALLCRAEELNLSEQIAFYTTFEMVEHLHNPSVFFYNLAKKGSGGKMIVTVPYVKRSRVGLSHVRQAYSENYFAEDEHIFELNPQDWTLLMLHGGWRVKTDRIHLQYPRSIPVLSQLLACFWRHYDFEGFWGVILEKDLSYANLYQDWEG